MIAKQFSNKPTSMHLLLNKSDINKVKNIKKVLKCKDSRTAKEGKQGRDDGIKAFSIQPNLHIFNVKRYVG